MQKLLKSIKVFQSYDYKCTATFFMVHSVYTEWAKKTGPFLKCMTPVYDEVGRQSIHQNVELFIRSKTNIRNVAIFKYSWHKFGETILRRIYQLI